MKTIKERFDNFYIPEPNTGCWLWIGAIEKWGYGKITIHENGKRFQEKVHRTSYRIFKGTIPHGLFVLHKCDVRCCVNPDHLFLGTLRDNSQDMIRKGRHRNQHKKPISF